MIKIYINKSLWSESMNFYIIDKDEISGKSHLIQFGKHSNTLKLLSENDADLEPSFRLNGIDGSEFLKAICDAANEFGIKTDADLKREGKLEATQNHLEDMRKLVFKNHVPVSEG